MAITRAQQVRQMLEDGGMLVSPSKDGKRPGYRSATVQTARREARTGKKQSTFDSEVEDQTTPEDRRETQLTGGDQGSGLQRVKTEKQKDDDKDFSFQDLPFIPSKKKAFNLATNLIPGSKKSTIKKRKAYADYLKSIGVVPTEELEDTDNLFRFFDKQAFENPVAVDANLQAPMSYGDFILENFGSPGVKFSGNVGDKEVYVKGYKADGSKIYDVRERTSGRDDDNEIFIPQNNMTAQASGSMDQEELSPIQQAILDRGTASAFLATGGRVGFFTGMRAQEQKEKAASNREDRRASQYKSTTAKAPPSMGFGNPPPSDGGGGGGGGDNQPSPLNVIDKIKQSRFNNPLTRGLARAGLYAINPTMGGLSLREVLKAKSMMDNLKGLGGLGDQSKLNTEEEEDDKGIMQMADALTTPTADTMGLNLMDRKTLKDAGYSNNQIQELQNNPNIDTQEIIRDIKGPIFAAADGGPVGGITDLESGRQMYFLGKLVKKATRAVKKIAKSPIGKAALFAAPFLASGGLGSLGTFLKTKAAPFLFKEGAGFAKGNIGFGELLRGGLTGGGSLALGGALTLAPLLFQEDTNEDDYQKFLAERGAGAQLPAPMVDIRNKYRDYMATAFLADGGRPEPVAKKTMPLLDMDGKEMDFRAEGGFVPIGRMERADDVPARLSKNEFVFTADAVRNAGEGDIDKGAEVMYNMMKNLESGGDVSEESQGLDGAREMFKTSQRLEEVI